MRAWNLRLFSFGSSKAMASDILFRQLFEKESSTYTYLIACPSTKACVLIDPVLETVDRDLQIVNELGLNLVLAINTHCHADHVTGTGELKKRVPGLKSGISEASGAAADVLYKPGDTITVGSRVQLTVRATPGHTNGCVTYVLQDYPAIGKLTAFTGDAVLIRGCGRTDFQQGDSELLWESVQKEIFSLPADTLLYPAHDYKGRTMTTVGEEMQHNPRLSKSKPEFVEIMKNLNLAYPKKIDVAVPANLQCGLQD